MTNKDKQAINNDLKSIVDSLLKCIDDTAIIDKDIFNKIIYILKQGVS